ncbi:hypothetical protein TBK1r_50690 [Stieleria magnilauensis]|uniref:Uncharacterized protein n=1 Tax=Stieleria magnilauensis TaxID=2527963 RepID=A0ABX5XWE2_9BACT|nr:hypothetical protein TBK1r_50690 [Planctomycetes bacterium TBK1r]
MSRTAVSRFALFEMPHGRNVGGQRLGAMDRNSNTNSTRRLRCTTRFTRIGHDDSLSHHRWLPMYSIGIIEGNRASHSAVNASGVGFQCCMRQASVCRLRPSRRAPSETRITQRRQAAKERGQIFAAWRLCVSPFQQVRQRTDQIVIPDAVSRKQRPDEIGWAQFERTNRSRDVRRWTTLRTGEEREPRNRPITRNRNWHCCQASVSSVNDTRHRVRANGFPLQYPLTRVFRCARWFCPILWKYGSNVCRLLVRQKSILRFREVPPPNRRTHWSHWAQIQTKSGNQMVLQDHDNDATA